MHQWPRWTLDNNLRETGLDVKPNLSFATVEREREMMKYRMITALLLLGAAAQADLMFTAISNWTDAPGLSGAATTNQSALVVDWNDGSGYLNDYKVFGYRWDAADSLSAEDMIRDIAESDSDLYFVVTFFSGLGQSIEGVGYDVDGDGFSLTPAEIFINGVADEVSVVQQISNDPDDLWNAGFDGGTFQYWQLYEASGLSIDPSSDWASASTGVTGSSISENSWSGLSYNNFNTAPPAAVPEPASAALFVIGLAGIYQIRRVSTLG